MKLQGVVDRNEQGTNDIISTMISQFKSTQEDLAWQETANNETIKRNDDTIKRYELKAA